MLVDGDIVTHLTERGGECADRMHGVVDSSVPANQTYDGAEHEGFVGVNWGKDQVRHPVANLLRCTCAVD